MWKDIGPGRYPVAYTGDCFDDAPNAEYIAAANPATVLALLDEIDRLRSDVNGAAECIVRQAQTIARLLEIEKAARNLAKVKGRHNSEMAMNQLLEVLK